MAGLLLNKPVTKTPAQLAAEQQQTQFDAAQKQREQEMADARRIADEQNRQEVASTVASMSTGTPQHTQAQSIQYGSAPTVQNTVQTPSQSPITQSSYEDQSMARLQAELAAQAREAAARTQAQAEQRRMAMLSTSGVGTTPGMVSHGDVTGDEAGARNAAFARAKEQAGQTALASLKALQEVMAGSGRMGSSMEAQGIADIVGEGMGDVNEFTRDKLIADLAREGEIADMNFQGQITQRGQNMSMTPSLLAMLTSSGTAY